MRSKLFWKLFVMYAVLTTASLIALTMFHLTDRSRLSHVHQDRRLRDMARILQQELQYAWGAWDGAQWEARLHELSKGTDTRICVSDPEGTLLASSHRSSNDDPRVLERHDLDTAADQGLQLGLDLTVAGRPLRYCVVPLRHDAQLVGFVRISELMRNVDADRVAHRRISLLLALLVTSIALLGTYIAVRELWRPVSKLTQAANQIAQGFDVAPVEVDRRSELLPLADALNRMNREIRRREEEYRGAADLLSTVLGGMAEGVLAVDRNQTLLFANAAAGSFLKFDPQLAQGRSIRMTIRNEALRGVIDDVLAGRSVLEDGPTEMRWEGNPTRVLALNAARLPGTPCPGVVIVMHDVSERRGLEEMRQQFVANVSHELKTPLSSIKLHAETLMAGALDDPNVNRQFVAEIEEQAERLHQLILDMLQLARIESGQQGLEIVPIDVGEVVESSLRYHQSAAEKKRIALIAEGAEPGIHVMADHEGIQQIMDNLIDNAVKYSPEGKRVLVRWYYEGETVVIDVQDEGPGIRVEDQERVFERFFRVDKARSREIGSTGLGLSIVKHLTRALGGGVKLKSEFGVGSTFSIHLPRAHVRVASGTGEARA